MKIWIDDTRIPPSKEWTWIKSVHDAKSLTLKHIKRNENGQLSLKDFNIVSFDHDAGKYADKGGDYIKYLDWLERFCVEHNVVDIPRFHIHTGNIVGEANLMHVCDHNNWTVLPYV